jgi:hypothetical protein
MSMKYFVLWDGTDARPGGRYLCGDEQGPYSTVRPLVRHYQAPQPPDEEAKIAVGLRRKALTPEEVAAVWRRTRGMVRP